MIVNQINPLLLEITVGQSLSRKRHIILVFLKFLYKLLLLHLLVLIRLKYWTSFLSRCVYNGAIISSRCVYNGVTFPLG